MAEKKNINWSIQLRPRKLLDVYGLEKIKTFAYKAVKKNEWPEAIMLQGRFGCGKTSLAQIFAQMMVCQNIGSDGEPCGVCSSCKSIVDETWTRDVINLDGAKDDSKDLIDKIDSFVATPPFKDKKKVLILDEVQALSPQCKQKVLKLIEAKRQNVHYIFTSMVEESSNSKMVEASIKALLSRCMVFRYPKFTEIDIMKYLYGIIKKLEIEAPKEFLTYGLQMIARNSDESLRKAVMILQQCIETDTFDVDGIKEAFGLSNIEDFYKTLFRMLEGENSEELFQTLLNVNDYDGMIRLSVLAFANAETYRLFGRINEFNGNGKKPKDKVDDELLDLFKQVQDSTHGARTMSDWQMNKTISDIKPLVEHKHYKAVRDMFMEFYKDNSIYTSKSAYILGMSKIIDYCRTSNGRHQRLIENIEIPTQVQKETQKRGRIIEG